MCPTEEEYISMVNNSELGVTLAHADVLIQNSRDGWPLQNRNQAYDGLRYNEYRHVRDSHHPGWTPLTTGPAATTSRW